MGDGEAPLPEGWEQAWDLASERHFYTHSEAGVTQWERPEAEASGMDLGSTERDVAAAIAVSKEEAELDWISDCFFAIFQAPTWLAPISTYIDEHCSVFEDMEENKLEYTPIHNAFRQLVDDLLAMHLWDLSVSNEQFARFCEQGLKGDKDLHRSIVEQLLSVDDFLVFKAMMVKRGAELHQETVLSSKRGANETEAFMPPTPTNTEADPRELGEVTGEDDDAAADAEEDERLEAQRRCVEAELQLVIAISLQLEQRLKLVEALEERLRLIERLSEVMEANRQQEEAMLQAEAEAQAEQVAAMEALKEELIPAVVRMQPLAPLGARPPISPCDDPPMPLSASERFALEKKRTEVALNRANRMPAAASAPARSAAAAAPAPELAAPAPPVPFARAGPTEEERKARAEHLKRQRELLIEKKNREREQQMIATSGQAAANAARMAGRAAAERAAGRPVSNDLGRQLAAELSGKADAGADSEAAAALARQTITRQLRQTLTGSLR